MNEPLLSICIPTYNRDYLIDICLNNICPIAKKYNIPIFISDNASPDNTEEVINNYTHKFNNVSYFRQVNNIGPDKNFEFVLKQPDTKYCWLFGDSAVIHEKNLIQLLDDLSKKEYDIYIIGSKDRTEGMNEKIYTSHNELLNELGWHITLLSCLIYNKTLLDKANFKRYYNSHFIQCGIIFEHCSYQSFYIKFNPAIQLDENNFEKTGGWYNTPFEVFCKDWFLYVISLPCNYSFESKKKCIMDHGIKSGLFKIRNIFIARMNNLFSVKILFKYKYFIANTIKYPTFLLFLIAIIPRHLLKIIKRIYLIRKFFIKYS
ncbi:MAG: glycosyltransferase family 2 protein [Bacteroidales bacterium]|jgi:glycosyltransferase involved in cell wall biosynthesis|nr:glycosyltransferase family 2 protein [Bacteroidales bacterium]